MKTSFWQKIILILFGIFATLLFLEIGLRLGGLTLLKIQEYRNRLALKHKGAYRIMCIGESTTQGQYPLFLEEVLDKSNIGIKFSVIDKGIGATNTSIIVSRLEENIRKYSPDMVVAMIGINDGGIHMPVGFNRPSQFPLTSLKVYKLAQLLLMHIHNKIEEIKGNRLHSKVSISSLENIETPSQNNVGAKGNILDRELENTSDVKAESYRKLELGKQLTAQGQIDAAKQAYKKSIELNPIPSDNIDSYFYLLWLSADPTERKEIFEKIFQHYKKLIGEDGVNDVPRLSSFCAVFIDNSEARMYLKELEGLLEKILARDQKNKEAAYNLVYMFLKQRRYSEAEEVLKRCAKLQNDLDSRFFDYFAILYHETGKFTLSEHYLREAHKLRPQYYSELTSNNYKKIKAILDAHKIKLVCVQYPLRSIENLKGIFYGENNIIFVDNEFSFKNALKKMSYEDLFNDLFAGDFGHCSQAGNKLLAENIANVILKEVF